MHVNRRAKDSFAHSYFDVQRVVHRWKISRANREAIPANSRYEERIAEAKRIAQDLAHERGYSRGTGWISRKSFVRSGVSSYQENYTQIYHMHRKQVCVDASTFTVFLSVLAFLADDDTGRNVYVTKAAIADLMSSAGCIISSDTVKRALRLARELDLLSIVLPGTIDKESFKAKCSLSRRGIQKRFSGVPALIDLRQGETRRFSAVKKVFYPSLDQGINLVRPSPDLSYKYLSTTAPVDKIACTKVQVDFDFKKIWGENHWYQLFRKLSQHEIWFKNLGTLHFKGVKTLLTACCASLSAENIIDAMMENPATRKGDKPLYSAYGYVKKIISLAADVAVAKQERINAKVCTLLHDEHIRSASFLEAMDNICDRRTLKMHDLPFVLKAHDFPIYQKKWDELNETSYHIKEIPTPETTKKFFRKSQLTNYMLEGR